MLDEFPVRVETDIDDVDTAALVERLKGAIGMQKDMLFRLFNPRLEDVFGNTLSHVIRRACPSAHRLVAMIAVSITALDKESLQLPEIYDALSALAQAAEGIADDADDNASLEASSIDTALASLAQQYPARDTAGNSGMFVTAVCEGMLITLSNSDIDSEHTSAILASMLAYRAPVNVQLYGAIMLFMAEPRVAHVGAQMVRALAIAWEPQLA